MIVKIIKLNSIKLEVIVFLTTIILLLSCISEGKSSHKNTIKVPNWHQLRNEKINIWLPVQFIPTSIGKLKNDVPFLQSNNSQLELIKGTLELLEGMDADLDFFTDTSSVYKVIIVCSFEASTDINVSQAGDLGHRLKLFSRVNAYKVGNIEVGDMSFHNSSKEKKEIMRFSIPISDKSIGQKVYNNIYGLTDDSYSALIYEFSIDEELLEEYLWKMKED